MVVRFHLNFFALGKRFVFSAQLANETFAQRECRLNMWVFRTENEVKQCPIKFARCVDNVEGYSQWIKRLGKHYTSFSESRLLTCVCQKVFFSLLLLNLSFWNHLCCPSNRCLQSSKPYSVLHILFEWWCSSPLLINNETKPLLESRSCFVFVIQRNSFFCNKCDWNEFSGLVQNPDVLFPTQVFQRRDGSIPDFHAKSWEEYAKGFGTLGQEFWWGKNLIA